MADNSMNKMRIIATLGVWFVILAIVMFVVKFWWFPKQEEVAEQEAEQHEQDVIDQTSSQSRYTHEVDFRADAFSGYAGFRSQAFIQECAKFGIKINLVDDGADYPNRLNALGTGKCDMAVFTLDALIKAGSQLGDIPATAVGLIDVTKGADAMVAAGGKYPNLDAINNPDVKIVCTANSPSETLARACMAYFNLDQLGPENFEFVDGAGAVYDAYKASSPTDDKVYILWEPYVSQVLENQDYHVLIDSSKFKNIIADILVVSRDYLVKNKPIVEKVTKAYYSAIFQHRNGMVSLVMEDAEALGEPLTTEQAERLVETIWWKNTQENYGHFGFTTGHNLQHMEEICTNVTDILLRTDAIKSDPTNGQPNLLYYDGIMRTLFDTSWHPGFGQEDVREESALLALSDEEWSQLDPIGTLSVPRLVFARGTSRLSVSSHSTLDGLLGTLDTWPQYYLIVRGHTSSVGDVEANAVLAEARAQAAVDYLLSKGVARNRIHAESSKPNGSTTVAFILGEVPY